MREHLTVTKADYPTLDELFSLLDAPYDDAGGHIDIVNMDTLPTYGGDEPEATDRVWSWDADRMIVSDDSGYSIVAR